MFLLCISVTEVTQILSVLIAITTCVFFGWQVRQKIGMSHAEQVSKMMTKVQDDPVLQDFFYDIEYNRFNYSTQFHGSDKEKTADKILHHYEYILYLHERGLLKDEEFRFFEYDIQKIVRNKDMIKYFLNLYKYCDEDLSFKYQRLLDYGEDKGYITKKFNK